ncbi:formylglycine-generating enzyme family protein [Flavobacteriaceae bacterium TP-CH-4]|uniref:Formylglycine-generating enzyme family protein n=1 Tax=Pelagihabitans pacificus TaxID=2696054 RepID=A0A967E6T4_9FLAO|nr:formylglycine-generating enzyme family protein [Pelagihabitans pacificus]NHF59509.1 formylglycine-generating enzyme family protein [Pelagihabitans pacificus]
MCRTLFLCTILFVFFSVVGCRDKTVTKSEIPDTVSQKNTPQASKPDILIAPPKDIKAPEGMVWIPGGEVIKGAVPGDKMAMDHEKPAHKVIVDGFFMDITEVTNAQFKAFVDATDYTTVAEREIDWEEMKKQLPAGTPKPPDSIMRPGSLTFKKTKSSVSNLYDFSQWWQWTIGANWKHPNGPGSNIIGKDNEPVVHISYEDAVAYCEWAGRRLPTEAEWERAARGNNHDAPFFWGKDASILPEMANTWEGEFPVTNTGEDGYERRAVVKSYRPNDFGLYDIAGNVWEWTSDWYNSNYYAETAASGKVLVNPQGASTPYNARDPYARERVIKGGSFLCSDSYCASYRISARMGTSLDSAQEHLGFRTVATVEMIRNEKG